jgi:Ala-tRNA(Pro) deacylase
MAATPEDLFARLAELGIAVRTVEHPPLFTVAESKSLRGELDGGHTKNLFLKDKKGRYFLVSVEEDAPVDLKTIHQHIGASGRVSFGSAERLMEYLGVLPGSVTLFGVINDAGKAVQVVIDADLAAHEVINAHPLTNEATTAIGRDDLLRFLQAEGHSPLILKVTG